MLFGATWSGRMRTTARVVGPLINTLPVRVRFSEAGTVRDLLGVLRQQHLALRHFQHTALRDIRAASPLAPFAQLFQTNVVFDNERFYSALPKQDTRWRGHKIWCRSQTSVPLVLAAYFLDGQETLRQMAAYFASLMREVQSRGPYAVAGFSAGGVAAMAIAEELRALGESTDFVGLIDSLTPLSVSVPSPFTTPRRLVRFSRTLVVRTWEVLNRPRPLPELWRRARLAILRSLTRWNFLEREHNFDEMFPNSRPVVG